MNRLLSLLLEPTDEQIMWRVKNDGDPHAFARLVDRWQGPIQRLCFRLTGDLHRAEDLAQTTFARVFAARTHWQPAGKFSTFLWRIAINLCHDESRRLARRAECSLDGGLEGEERSGLELIASDQPTPLEETDSRERGDLVREALLKLAPQYREIVVLRHYQQLKFHEIAAVLAVPEGTAKTRMAEALRQLQHFLKPLNRDVP